MMAGPIIAALMAYSHDPHDAMQAWMDNRIYPERLSSKGSGMEFEPSCSLVDQLENWSHDHGEDVDSEMINLWKHVLKKVEKNTGVETNLSNTEKKTRREARQRQRQSMKAKGIRPQTAPYQNPFQTSTSSSAKPHTPSKPSNYENERRSMQQAPITTYSHELEQRKYISNNVKDVGDKQWEDMVARMSCERTESTAEQKYIRRARRKEREVQRFEHESKSGAAIRNTSYDSPALQNPKDEDMSEFEAMLKLAEREDVEAEKLKQASVETTKRLRRGSRPLDKLKAVSGRMFRG